MNCAITWETTSENETVDPAHIGTAGRGVKEHDFHVLPLIHRLHVESHQRGEAACWGKWLLEHKQPLKEALQAWGTVLYLKHKLKVKSNLALVEIINEMIDEG